MITLTRDQAEFVAEMLRKVENYEIKSDNSKFDAILTHNFRRKFTEIADEIERQLKDGEAKKGGMVRKRSGWFYQWVDSQT